MEANENENEIESEMGTNPDSSNSRDSDIEPDFIPSYFPTDLEIRCSEENPYLVPLFLAISAPQSVKKHRAKTNPILNRCSKVLDLTNTFGFVARFAIWNGARKAIVLVESSREKDLIESELEKEGFGLVVEVQIVSDYLERKSANGIVEAGKGDVLISDWMGTCVFSRSKIRNFISVRDLGGCRADDVRKIFPSRISMFIAGVHDESREISADGENFKFCGFDFRKLFEDDPDSLTGETSDNHFLSDEGMRTNLFQFATFDLRTISISDLANFKSQPFNLTFLKKENKDKEDDGTFLSMNAFVISFSAEFGPEYLFSNVPHKDRKNGPWPQSVLYLGSEIRNARTNDQISGTLNMSFGDSEKLRDFNVTLDWVFRPFIDNDEIGAKASRGKKNYSFF